MAHNLIVHYGLYKEMDVFVSQQGAAGESRQATAHPSPLSLTVSLSTSRFVPLPCYLSQRPPLIDHTEMTRFHSDDYINFLRSITPDNMTEHLKELQKCEDRGEGRGQGRGNGEKERKG